MKAAAISGLYGLMTRSTGPQIRGGEAAALVTLSCESVEIHQETYDLLVAVDWLNTDRFAAEIMLPGGSLVIGDSEKSDDTPAFATQGGARRVDLPFKEIAASIAGGNPFGIAVQACRFGIAAFIVPYLFAYNPALLGIEASVMTIVLAAITAIAGALSLAAAVQGWALDRLNWLERIGFLTVAGLMMAAGWRTDLAGLVLLLGLLLWQLKRIRSMTNPQTSFT